MLAAQATLARLPVTEFLQKGSRVALASAIAAQSSALAYADAFLIAGVLAILVSPAVLLLARKRVS